jgi:trimethylamine---corrinoid protein Co-methyltransferase
LRQTSGRRGQRAARSAGGVRQRPWKQPVYRYRPVELISADQVEAIHNTALQVLEEIGMKVLDGRAREYLRSAGAEVDDSTSRVRIPKGLITTLIGEAPQSFTLRARNPERNLIIDREHTVFSAVGGPAFVADLDRGRRNGTYAEMCDFIRLVHSLNALHQEGGGPFEPLDLPASTRHLDLHFAQITLTDKNWQPLGLGKERALDGLEMAAIALGTTREGLRDTPVFTCVINTNSPLQLDVPMAEGLIAMAEHGQCVVITPFTLAGAMSPITIAGALAQQHAEALAGIALCQIVRRKAPVIYGGFTSNVDMRTGAPAFGTPEYAQAAQVSGQLARFIKIPFRSSNVTTANEADAQAAYESQMALWGAITGQAHLVLHAAGWLGGGLTASFEKLIIDAEMLQMMSAYLEPFEVTPESLAFEAMAEVGPAGHYFGASHTMSRYETAFYSPLVSNWDNYDNWVERGRQDAIRRANQIWKKLLAEYQPPPIDPGIEEALKDYVGRRKRQGGAAVK